MYGAEPNPENAYDRDNGVVMRGVRAGGGVSFSIERLKVFSKIIRKTDEVFEFVFFELVGAGDDF